MKQTRMMLCRSQSEALLLSHRLSACGVDAIPVRPPRTRNVRACTWGLKLEARESGRAEDCLSELPPELWRWEDEG